MLRAMKREPTKHHRLLVGPVNNSAAILAKGGPDTRGWSRAMSSSEVGHALKRHGKGSSGWASGSRLTMADLARIPQITEQAHHIEIYPRSDFTRIKYKARLTGRTYTYIETVGRKRQELGFKNLWWKN